MAVVCRHQLTRAGLAAFLSCDPERAVVCDLTGAADRRGYDVAVYDLAGLVDTTQNDLAHLLASRIPVVALQPPGRHDLAEVARRLGVAAIVPMSIDPTELLSILDMAAAGRCVDEHADRARRREQARRKYDLTERELDILEVIGTGVSNAEVCEQLYLSINTIKSYVQSSYKKIGASSRSQAVLWALEHLPARW